MSEARKAGMLGMAMALGAMNMLAPTPYRSPPRKPETPQPQKPQRTKNRAQKKARKAQRKARK